MKCLGWLQQWWMGNNGDGEDGFVVFLLLPSRVDGLRKGDDGF